MNLKKILAGIPLVLALQGCTVQTQPEVYVSGEVINESRNGKDYSFTVRTLDGKYKSFSSFGYSPSGQATVSNTLDSLIDVTDEVRICCLLGDYINDPNSVEIIKKKISHQ